jgi:hypothetical protein
MQAINNSCHEFLAHGSDMSQRYISSAIFSKDAGDVPALPSNPILYHVPHTFPGVRLPHAWLNTSIPDQHPVSTLDLAGNGRFAIFIGHGGNKWQTAAASLGNTLGIDITVIPVGYGLQYEAVYNAWYYLREVEEDGCVLVRPDNFIAWRSKTVVADCEHALNNVFKTILSLN